MRPTKPIRTQRTTRLHFQIFWSVPFLFGLLIAIVFWLNWFSPSVQAEKLTPRNNNQFLPQTLVPMDGIVQVSAGGHHTCALTIGAGVKCWGYNSEGQFGDGSITNRNTPVDVVGLGNDVATVAVSGGHNCVLTKGGGVKCWGGNRNGQLGDGSITNRNTPVDVVGLSSGVVAIAAGGGQTCALTMAGGIKCWGSNRYGQLGDGTTLDRSTPVDVTGLSIGMAAVEVGNLHVCALSASGEIKCWGRNDQGQLGDGSTADKTAPTNVVGLGNEIADIAAGHSYTCILTTVGAVKCWGFNSYGQLGDGSATNRTTPTDVVGLGSDVANIATGSAHTCVLTKGGEVKCWGNNYYGEVGDGTTQNIRFTPVDVVGLGSGIVTVAAGGSHTCALITTGGVKCWGANYLDQLGNGTTTIWSTPVDVLVKPSNRLPPLLVVHGIQLFDSGYECVVAPKPFIGDTTLGDLPNWFPKDFQVWIAHLDSKPAHTPSIETNAGCLNNQISWLYEQTGRQKITIIAHSMGGLVSRACLSLSDCRDKVGAIYTLGSPHGGLNADTLAKILLTLRSPVTGAGLCVAQPAICQFGSDNMAFFNAANPNQSSITYTFIGGDATPRFPLGWLLWPTEGSNDGLVGRQSAVGWASHTNSYLPSNWPDASMPSQYWTDETHIGDWGNAYYENRPDTANGYSQSYDCIQLQMGKIPRPDFCRDPLAVQQTRTATAVPSLSQTTASVSGQISTGQTVTHTLSIDTAAASLFTRNRSLPP